MAHATDYQSRPVRIWDKQSVLSNQLRKFFYEHADWSRDAVVDHCSTVYADMGATRENVRNAHKQWLYARAYGGC